MVNLTREEYNKIGKLWPDKVIIRKKRPYLRRDVNGKCEFLSGKLCSLQLLGMKPFACKVWPFKVSLKPDKLDKEFDGLYIMDEKEYFVYLNPKCTGINKGDPFLFRKSIEEVIALWNGSKKEQYYSTNTDYLTSLSFLTQNFISSPLTEKLRRF